MQRVTQKVHDVKKRVEPCSSSQEVDMVSIRVRKGIPGGGTSSGQSLGQEEEMHQKGHGWGPDIHRVRACELGERTRRG